MRIIMPSLLTILGKVFSMIKALSKKKQRTEKQLLEHYEIERKLADRLRNASKNERRTLYKLLYEELYRLIPHHPQLTRKTSPEERQEAIKNQMKLLNKFLYKNASFLEVGPGDCTLALEVAKFVKEVHAVDVSKTITEASNTPGNFKLHLSDGFSIPVPENSIDIIYSNLALPYFKWLYSVPCKGLR
jgi:hypothetical protein